MPPIEIGGNCCFIAAVNQATDEDVLEMVTRWAVPVWGLGEQIQTADVYPQNECGGLWQAPTHETSPSHIIQTGRSRCWGWLLLTDPEEMKICFCGSKRKGRVVYLKKNKIKIMMVVNLLLHWRNLLLHQDVCYGF